MSKSQTDGELTVRLEMEAVRDGAGDFGPVEWGVRGFELLWLLFLYLYLILLLH